MAEITSDTWATVRQEYMAGWSLKDIADKHSLKIPTIRKQIERKGWFERKKGLAEKLSKVVAVEVLNDAKGLVERGNAMLEAMANDAEASIATLTTQYTDPVGFDELEKRERTAGMLVKRIRETCGLDDVKPSGVVLIGQLRSFDDVKEVKTVDIESQVDTE